MVTSVPHSLEDTDEVLKWCVEFDEYLDGPSDGVGVVRHGVDVSRRTLAVLLNVVLQQELEDVGNREDVLVGADTTAQRLCFYGDRFPRRCLAFSDSFVVCLFDEELPCVSDGGQVAEVGLMEKQ